MAMTYLGKRVTCIGLTSSRANPVVNLVVVLMPLDRISSLGQSPIKNVTRSKCERHTGRHRSTKLGSCLQLGRNSSMAARGGVGGRGIDSDVRNYNTISIISVISASHQRALRVFLLLCFTTAVFHQRTQVDDTDICYATRILGDGRYSIQYMRRAPDTNAPNSITLLRVWTSIRALFCPYGAGVSNDKVVEPQLSREVMVVFLFFTRCPAGVYFPEKDTNFFNTQHCDLMF